MSGGISFVWSGFSPDCGTVMPDRIVVNATRESGSPTTSCVVSHSEAIPIAHPQSGRADFSIAGLCLMSYLIGNCLSVTESVLSGAIPEEGQSPNCPVDQ